MIALWKAKAVQMAIGTKRMFSQARTGRRLWPAADTAAAPNGRLIHLAVSNGSTAHCNTAPSSSNSNRTSRIRSNDRMINRPHHW